MESNALRYFLNMSRAWLFIFTLHLYLSIYQTRLSKATYSAFRLYIFCQYVCSLEI